MTQENRKEYHKIWLKIQYGDYQYGDRVRLPVLNSGSMLPYVVPEGTIEIKCIPWRKSQKGDIIVYKEGRRLVAHRQLFRIFLRKRCFVFQKGDADTFGKWTCAERVIGIVVESFDANGKLVYTKNGAERKDRMCVYRQVFRDIYARMLIIPRNIKNRMQGRDK